MTVCVEVTPPPSLSPSRPPPGRAVTPMEIPLSSPLPPSALHYLPPSRLSSPHSSPQSVDLPHTGLIPVTVLSHIIHHCNMYAIAGRGVQGGAENSWGQSKKLVKPRCQGRSRHHNSLSVSSLMSVKCKESTWYYLHRYILCTVVQEIFSSLEVKVSIGVSE